MRDFINNAMPMLIWITLGFMVAGACTSGVVLVIQGFALNQIALVFSGFFGLIFGLAFSFLFAGLCFQVLDIRKFTKYAAMNAKR